MISVLIVDDHNLVRLALKKILTGASGITVIGEAVNGKEAIELVRELKPDVVLMDLEMPEMGGLEATQQLLRSHPNIKIIALTVHDKDPVPYGFISAGAAGYLTKDTSENELITAIRNVHAGYAYITPDIAQELAINQIKKTTRSPFTTLSEREWQVMWLIAKGQKTKEIGHAMHLSIKTISTYKSRLFKKLNVKNDFELMQLALQYNVKAI